MKTTIEKLLHEALAALPDWELPDAREPAGRPARLIEVERPRDARRGDFSSNLALRLAANRARDPRRVAAALVAALPRSPAVARVEVAGAGFINFFAAPAACAAEVGRILAADHGYGRAAAAGAGPVAVVSAEIAGPLQLGHARRAAFRAALANLFAACGQAVELDHRGERLPLLPVRLHRGGVPCAPPAVPTFADLCREVGRDTAQLSLLMRGANQPLSIDLALAAARSIDNPAYCIRYAHARMANVQAELAARGLVHDAANGAAAMRLLGTAAELRLMRRLGAFPDVVADCALRCAPHALLRYLRELAQDCHRNDAAQPGVVADAGLRDARLNLARATRIVLRNGLGLLGVAAPDHM